MLLYLRDGPYMFRENNAILREQLGSFLSYFNVIMLGGKSECNKIIQKV
jgi:predicted nucleic acid-binding Zn finger protein